MVDDKNFFDQPINDDTKTYESIGKKLQQIKEMITQLLVCSCFKENYKMIEIDFSKQQALDSDPRAIQQIDFTANLHRAGNTTLFFIIEEAIVTVSDFYKELQKFRKCVIE